MVKMLQFNEKALQSVLKGVKMLAKAVTPTLGPKGRNVIIQEGIGAPLSTKDGVTIAEKVVLKDKFENIGAALAKEAASRTSEAVGDGTTTTIVLTEAIFKEGAKNVAAGSSPIHIKRGMDRAVQVLLEELDRLATPVKKEGEIQQVATISANNDPEVGKIVASAMKKVGKDGTITLADAQGIDTVLDVVEGMKFDDRGYLSPYFVTHADKMTVELSNVSIFITDKKLSSAKEIVSILEKGMELGQNPVLIIAEDVEEEALATLVLNKLKGGASLCAVKAPGFGDRRKAILQDVAILTGATVVSEEVGLNLEQMPSDVFGRAKSVKISKDETIIIDGLGQKNAIEKRAQQIRYEINETTSDYDRKHLEERLAKLAGGVAVIHVGGTTEAEIQEKKARVEDALHATRAAVLGGIVPGGGVALLRAIHALDGLNLEGDEKIGVEIIRRAAFAPATAIARNCGKEGNMVAEKIYSGKGAFGYNGLTDTYGDLLKEGVIEPVLVTKNALMNASSIAGLLMTIACAITEKLSAESSSSQMGGGGMPGMGGMGGMGGMPGMGMM